MLLEARRCATDLQGDLKKKSLTEKIAPNDNYKKQTTTLDFGAALRFLLDFLLQMLEEFVIGHGRLATILDEMSEEQKSLLAVFPVSQHKKIPRTQTRHQQQE